MADGKTSKYLGVTWLPSRKQWQAQIRVDLKIKFLGRFPGTRHGEKLAAIAYDRAAVKYRGRMACLNFESLREALTKPQESRA